MSTTENITAEKAAVTFLEKRGYDILSVLDDCGVDELVVVAADHSEHEDGTLAFVQVQSRHGSESGLPEEDLGPNARAAMELAAMRFMEDHDEPNCRVRFDEISVVFIGESRAFIRHHQNKFGV